MIKGDAAISALLLAARSELRRRHAAGRCPRFGIGIGAGKKILSKYGKGLAKKWLRPIPI